MSPRRDKSRAPVAKCVAILRSSNQFAVSRRYALFQMLDHQHIARPHEALQRWMEMQHRHHRRTLGKLKLSVEIRLDEHPLPSFPSDISSEMQFRRTESVYPPPGHAKRASRWGPPVDL